MSTFRVGSIVVFVLAMLGCVAFGQTAPSVAPGPAVTADELPDALLRGNLFAVVIFDLQSGDKTAWNNAVMVISGGRPSTRPLGANDPLPMGMDQSIGPFFKMGAERIAIAMATDAGNMDMVLGIRLREGANETAATDWLHRNARANARFTREGTWLVARVDANSGRPVNTTLPPSAQADDVRLALNCCGDDMAIKVVFLTSEPVKRQMMQGGPPPAPLENLTNLYWSAKYLYLGAKLGADPKVEGRWIAPDNDGADSVVKELEVMHQRLKQPNGNFPGIIPFFAPILDQCHPVREENVVRASANQSDLKNIFTGILVASMRNSNQQQPQGVAQTPVAANWAPLDAATDAACSQMRLILAAIAEYDRENNAMPASLDELVNSKLVPGVEIFHDPRTGSDAGFAYVKPDGVTKLADIKTPGKTGILYEEKNGKADEGGVIGYADGTVKVPK